MKITLLPRYRIGKWSVGLGTFTLSVFIFLYIFAELLKVISSDIIVTIFGTASVLTSLISFYIGIITVIKNEERSVLVILCILLGFVVFLFIIGEILGLHNS